MGAAEKEKEVKVRRKPGRVPTSCAECRRLKLRCDRSVPCEKCVSRGCGAICPDGSLTAGKGNRLVLANTEQLHERIEHLCSRIRELETGLRTLQASVSDEPHPLLTNNLLQLKAPTTISATQTGSSRPVGSGAQSVVPMTGGEGVGGQDENFIDAFGTLTLGPKGEGSFLGKTARSEYLIRALSKPARVNNLVYPRVSNRIINSCCEEVNPPTEENAIGREVFSLLPQLSEAIRLCEIYLEYGKIFFNHVPRNELIDDIVTTIYRAESFDSLSSYHTLSLLFIIFALASLFDTTKPPYSIEAQEYYYLSRAAFGLTPSSQDASLTSIQALVHMAQYKEFSDWEAVGSNTSWSFMGVAVKYAHSIGLHLNSSRWKLSDEMGQRRSRVFWAVFCFDTSMSFHLGRPPSINPAYVDCPPPRDPEERINSEGQKESSYMSWYWHYTTLMHVIIPIAFGSKPPSYTVILDLDRRIRDFPVPINLRWQCDANGNTLEECYLHLRRYPDGLCLQRWALSSTKEITLLNLHRAYFAQALQDSPNDVTTHRYFPSVMAAYRSAWRLLRVLFPLWRRLPNVMARSGIAWSAGLSASIVMCILVTRSPTSKMTKQGLEELDAAANLFEEAAPRCRSAANMLESVLNLRRRAHEAVEQASTASPDPGQSCPTLEELNRLGGGTHLISQGASTPVSQPSPSNTCSTSTSASSPSSAQTPPDMHPTIIEDIRNLDAGLGWNIFDLPPNNGDLTTMSSPAAAAGDVQMADFTAASEQFSSFFASSQAGAGMGAMYAPPPPSTSMVGGFGSPAPMLDATWQSFVEQLGF